MTMLFSGQELAEQKEEILKLRVDALKKEGIAPKLISILVGGDEASRLFLSLKKRAAERIGAEVEIKHFLANTTTQEIVRLIKALNNDLSVHGIMLQLPLPETFSKLDRLEMVTAIDSQKDVDGMKEGSSFIAPVARAVYEAVKAAEKKIHLTSKKIVVIGSKGFAGGKIIRELKKVNKYRVLGCDTETKGFKKKIAAADIVISATGKEGLITGKMIKEGAVVIDVGCPRGDVKTEEIMDKAVFISAVPGGVGPVTIACLLENLIASAKD